MAAGEGGHPENFPLLQHYRADINNLRNSLLDLRFFATDNVAEALFLDDVLRAIEAMANGLTKPKFTDRVHARLARRQSFAGRLQRLATSGYFTIEASAISEPAQKFLGAREAQFMQSFRHDEAGPLTWGDLDADALGERWSEIRLFACDDLCDVSANAAAWRIEANLACLAVRSAIERFASAHDRLDALPLDWRPFVEMPIRPPPKPLDRDSKQAADPLREFKRIVEDEEKFACQREKFLDAYRRPLAPFDTLIRTLRLALFVRRSPPDLADLEHGLPACVDRMIRLEPRIDRVVKVNAVEIDPPLREEPNQDGKRMADACQAQLQRLIDSLPPEKRAQVI